MCTTNNCINATLDERKKKFLMDSVYGLIELDNRLFQIIDTPHFQRLRYIKQLGTAYFCFPTATHTRFSHSIGTAYLAGELFDKLASCDKTLDLRPIDRLILQTAGLVHDLGHGPFSHSFEHSIVPQLLGHSNWNHEAQGLRLLDHLLDTEEVTLFDTSETKRLKQILTGEISQEYHWLSQMISNSDYGLDVDRLDYIQRDSYSVGLQPGFNFTVLSSHVRVIDGKLTFHEKRKSELLQFYQSRYNLYHQIYHHPTIKAIELTLADAIINAEPDLKIRETLENIDKFLVLNDGIYNIMERSKNQKTKDLINNICRRRFYPLIYRSETLPPPELLLDQNNILDRTVCNYGYGDENPLDKVPYYSTEECKHNNLLLPCKFEQVEYRVYGRTCRTT